MRSTEESVRRIFLDFVRCIRNFKLLFQCPACIVKCVRQPQYKYKKSNR